STPGGVRGWTGMATLTTTAAALAVAGRRRRFAPPAAPTAAGCIARLDRADLPRWHRSPRSRDATTRRHVRHAERMPRRRAIERSDREVRSNARDKRDQERPITHDTRGLRIDTCRIAKNGSPTTKIDFRRPANHRWHLQTGNALRRPTY